ncbi:unnamed protein product [Cyprideis torosa]|uniref:Uncharacterized protein n=1 Tax=Cyprideis torosa TaxID=163714 RepID=A0A7R8W3G4_9CRUS|nr:unnamed protein product [Cyprideis torosa]CAG0882996.1 unnamed protein product [Cyprideis torosa]
MLPPAAEDRGVGRKRRKKPPSFCSSHGSTTIPTQHTLNSLLLAAMRRESPGVSFETRRVVSSASSRDTGEMKKTEGTTAVRLIDQFTHSPCQKLSERETMGVGGRDGKQSRRGREGLGGGELSCRPRAEEDSSNIRGPPRKVFATRCSLTSDASSTKLWSLASGNNARDKFTPASPRRRILEAIHHEIGEFGCGNGNGKLSPSPPPPAFPSKKIWKGKRRAR